VGSRRGRTLFEERGPICCPSHWARQTHCQMLLWTVLEEVLLSMELRDSPLVIRGAGCIQLGH